MSFESTEKRFLIIKLMEKKNIGLFSEFPAPTYEQWREVTEKSIKGASFEKKLVTNTYEGIALQPMYRKVDLANLKSINSLPGQAPYLRGNNVVQKEQPWIISQELAISTPEKFNQVVLHDIARGQTGLNIVLDEPTKKGISANERESEVGKTGLSVSGVEDLVMALKGIDLKKIPLFVHAGVHSLPVFSLLLAALKRNKQDRNDLSGCIGMDPIGELVREGSLSFKLEDCYDGMVDLVSWANKETPKLKTVIVSGNVYHDGGSSAVEELAFSLATGVEYLQAMTTKGVDINIASPAINFTFSVGTDYFTEVAKLRAARLLWTTIVKAFGGQEEAQKMHIHARTSSWTKTVYDPYVNMLRGTTETFAAAVGGADSIHVSPFDEPIQKSTAFSRRIARNTSVILQEEAHIARTADPVGGSWYVEVLTNEIAKKAWALLQKIEEKGGIIPALKQDFPQMKIADTSLKRANNVALRKDSYVGTNMYANLNEKEIDVKAEDDTPFIQRHLSDVKHRKQKSVTSIKNNSVTSLIEEADMGVSIGVLSQAVGRNSEKAIEVTSIKATRGAVPFEQLRSVSENYAKKTGKRLSVFLVNYGPISVYKTRADFVAEFFEVGGFEVHRNNGFTSIDEAVKTANESEAEIMVICSTDKNYQKSAVPLTQSLKQHLEDTTVLLAGNPTEEEISPFKKAGIEDFIHLQTNCYEMLRKLQKKEMSK